MISWVLLIYQLNGQPALDLPPFQTRPACIEAGNKLSATNPSLRFVCITRIKGNG